MPVNLDDIKRNGYPCPSREFWWLVDEVEALRAALAARPQPLFEGTASRFVVLFDQLHSPIRSNQEIVVYPAVAGSATPTTSVRNDTPESP